MKTFILIIFTFMSLSLAQASSPSITCSFDEESLFSKLDIFILSVSANEQLEVQGVLRLSSNYEAQDERFKDLDTLLVRDIILDRDLGARTAKIEGAFEFDKNYIISSEFTFDNSGFSMQFGDETADCVSY